MQTSDRELYWIQSGSVPVGPFDAAEIQAKHAASEFTSDVNVCRVGGEEWMPIAKFFAVVNGDDAQVKVDTPLESKTTPAIGSTPWLDKFFPAAEAIFTSIAARREARIGAAVFTAIGAIWLISWWLTPLTPRQVVQRFVVAEGAEEGFEYTTLNLKPALRALEQVEDTSDPSDRYELTQDKPAPPDVGGHYVGFRYHFRDTGTKQLIQGEGVFHLIDADGWKIDDLFFTGFNGEALPEPVSMARDYRKLVADLPKKAKPPVRAGKRKPGEVIADAIFGPKISAWLDSGVGRFTTVCVLCFFVALEIYKRRKARETA